MWKTRVNLQGQRFGKLVVSTCVGRYSDGYAKWECLCDCGRKTFANKVQLTNWKKSCKECSYEDFAGRKVGTLFVVKRCDDKYNKNGNPIIQWECQCDCGEVVIRTSRLLRRGNCCCKRCKAEFDRELFTRGYQEIPKAYWNSVKRNAKIRGIPFEITEEHAWGIFEQQNRCCAMTGVVLLFAKSKKEHLTGGTTASLDRIDSSKHYFSGNIQWVHKWVNCMKYDLTQEEFIELCRKVVDFQNEKTQTCNKKTSTALQDSWR